MSDSFFINRAFDSTMKSYGISAKWLAQESGLSEVTISRFRTCKQPILTDNLQRLLDCLPPEARTFFAAHIGEGQHLNWHKRIEEMNLEELAGIMDAVAARIKYQALQSDKAKVKSYELQPN